MIIIIFLKKKIISKKNRFKLSSEQNKEIKKKFYNSNILIIGAAGSIGSVFTLSMINYNFKKLFLIDKDENSLTELNREILVKNKKTVKKVEFICSDLNLLDLRKIILENKINHYLNFAAIKHVRSEENYVSSKYMYQTNSKNFLPNGLRNVKPLKSIFSISTDKAVYPSSMLGVSKRLMELRLMGLKKRHKNLFVSTVRFANVSFSNGSILKLIIDRLVQKKNFGIPENISRYFITHDEAVSLCLKSLLKKNNYCIVVPNKKILGKQTLIFTYLLKILKILKIKVKRKINFFQRNQTLQKIYLVKGKHMLRRTFIAAAAASSIATATLAGGHSKDIVDTAIGAGSFGTLVAAVQAAGLVEVLKGEGPFTVFAPTDEAFAALPAGTVETLLKPENKDQLINILTYHVLPGKVMSADIAGKSLEVKMVNGGTAKIDATDGVQIDAANVVSADIEASNGVIHVIDAVILPAE